MRFSENEMTQALAGAAKSVLAAQRRLRPGRGRGGEEQVEQQWEALSRYERFVLLSSVGDQVLPVLVALPDVEVAPGTRPTYTDEQVTAAVEEVTDDSLGRVRRTVAVRSRVVLVQAALAAVPVRTDPDTFTVPDHL